MEGLSDSKHPSGRFSDAKVPSGRFSKLGSVTSPSAKKRGLLYQPGKVALNRLLLDAYEVRDAWRSRLCAVEGMRGCDRHLVSDVLAAGWQGCCRRQASWAA
jgi:hypothetical protein